MMIVVFLEILRAVFCALFFTMKLPKPLKYTFSLLAKESFTTSIKDSTVANTDALSTPVFFAISFTMSALVILFIFIILIIIMRLLFSKILDCKYIAFFSTRKINIGFF